MLMNYLRTAWAVFQRRKLFTAINLLCIVLTLVVLLVVTALLQEAFFPTGVEHRSDRFLQISLMESTNQKGDSLRRSPLGYKVIDKYLKDIPGVEVVGASAGPDEAHVYRNGGVTDIKLRHTDAGYWQIMDFKVLAGRVLDAEDIDKGRMVAVLTGSMARKLFGSVGALGEKVDIGGQVFEVVGVVEDALHFNAFSDMWVPVTSYPSSEFRHQMSGNFTALLMARNPDELPALRQRVVDIAKTITFGDDPDYTIARMWADSKIDVVARSLTSSREIDPGSGKVIAGIAAFMLVFMLLPALNLVNLNVGRIMERSTEIGVRKAFGASSGQLALQLVLENVLLCLAGGAIALLAARCVLWWLEAAGPIRYLKVEMSLAVFGWGLLITLVFGVLSGVIPAWKMSRLDPVHALKGAA
jgi:putative ABC transport system permease protein